MTQEEKQLLLKDLCARLFYGFIIHRYSDNVDITINTIDDFSHFLEYSEGEEFKPYLRPMSSMTEEEWNEFGDLYDPFREEQKFHEIVDWLNEHNFDYRGLIPMGLALEAPKDMYKIK